MNTFRWMLPLLGIAFLAGCNQNTGYVIKPIPLDETLQETVVAKDPGWLISDKIAVLDVDGVLMNVRGRGGLFGPGENPVSLFTEKLDKAMADSSVKAVIVRINSPGGGVTASDIMYHQLQSFRRQRGGPVIAMIEDVGASGGYYIACGSDHIMAHPTSVVGSIGTIVQMFSLSGTMKLIHLDAQAVVSGPKKDMGSPFKPLDPKDVELIQAMVDEYYETFLKVVGGGRPKLNEEQIRKLADGRVYTGQQALDNGLVDSLGYMDDAIQLARQAGKLNRVKVVMYHRPLGYRANAYSQTPGAPSEPQFSLVNISGAELLSAARPSFLYLWTGHTYR